MHLFLELTREPMAQQLDREARRRLALAGEELVRRYRAGLLKDCGQVADLLALTSLLAEDDPLFEASNGRFSIRLSTGLGRKQTSRGPCSTHKCRITTRRSRPPLAAAERER